MYFYHPDHLGSSSYITDREGRITQHTEYIAFGEVLFEEHSTSTTMPYLFNGKELDTETGLYYYGARYYDPKTSIFLNVDPLAEKYPNKTPYHYVSNNPINRIDPWGLTDYIVNGEHQQINDGHNDISMKVTRRQFNRLQRLFEKGGTGYERLMNRLSVRNGYTTYENNGNSLKDGFTITEHKPGGDSYGQWSIDNNNRIYGKVNDIIAVTDALAGSLVDQAKNINIGSNNKLYYRQNSGRIFNGNQYVTTISVATKYRGLVKGIKIGGPAIGIVTGGYDIYQGIQQDGGEFGYNAQRQTAGVVGGLAGGWIGAEAGASAGAFIGSFFGGVGAVPGAIIGGFIGGAFGAFGGGYAGGEAAKAIIE